MGIHFNMHRHWVATTFYQNKLLMIWLTDLFVKDIDNNDKNNKTKQKTPSSTYLLFCQVLNYC